MLAGLPAAGWRGAIYALPDGRWELFSGGLKGPVPLSLVPWDQADNRIVIAQRGMKSITRKCPVQGRTATSSWKLGLCPPCNPSDFA
ncbi:MAG TPA: hypothetical protein VE981_09910 [Planctomycetota bacterium]|nr:hypothetical protein [Planctomycetota bacterium]